MKKSVVYFEDVDNPNVLVRRRSDIAEMEYLSKNSMTWKKCKPGSSYEREYYLAQGNCCLFEISHAEAKQRLREWNPGLDVTDSVDFTLKLHEAIRYAEEKHRGQVRKGTEISYIVHPLEVLQILMGEKCSIELAIAGVLHDVVEDTDGTLEEIRDRFGERTAELVAAHTEKKKDEGKERPWKERKLEALEHLKYADQEVKQLVMADSISNLRSMVYDYKMIGDKLWDRFNAGKEAIGWFYNKKIDLFEEFQYDENIKAEYWEMNSLFKHLFVDFYILESDDKHCLFQKFHDEIYTLQKDEMVWKTVSTVPDRAEKISKEFAEWLEDGWRSRGLLR